MQVDVQGIRDQVQAKGELIRKLRAELAKAVVGQESMVSRLLVALLTGGHILLEGVPGLAKTTAVKALADAVHTEFRRIQFTPDLLPADLIGTLIYNPQAGGFSVRKGPIFSNFILADEVNRAPSKVQSALLQAMEERAVTIGDVTYSLDRLFVVLATQNPIEQEGTYPLPEAQVDRFMLKVKMTYPKVEEERKVLDLALDGALGKVEPVLTVEDVFSMQDLVRRIYVDEEIRAYILRLVLATRDPAGAGLADLAPLIDYGGSPRATIFLALGARALAFLAGRGYVTPQDVKDVAPDVLRHRILVTYEAEAERKSSDDVLRVILNRVPVP
jgi:MoxR-like ATPase